VRAALDIAETSLAPDELMHRILLAPVDLFYNGGIGTYIKASKRNPRAGQGTAPTTNIRVNGNGLRCRVVAEGGNLGARPRMAASEFALAGGRIFTDAIDNSAGVDCSDHEVNVKILARHRSQRRRTACACTSAHQQNGSANVLSRRTRCPSHWSCRINAVAVRCRQFAGVDFGVEPDLDVDFVVGAVHAGRVVDRIGEDAPARQREFDAAILGRAQVAAFGHHPAAQPIAVHPDVVVGRGP